MVSWAVAAAVLGGCGYVVRLGLERATGHRSADGLAWADVWIGLAGAVAYAHVWSLFIGIRWPALLPLVGVGALGWARARRFVRRPAGILSTVPVAVGLLVVWLANLALGPPAAPDAGLYHLGAIGYIRSFGTVPGLANLNYHFAADDAHFLYVALLDGSPWGFAGFHLANGLLVAMLLGDVGARLVGRRGREFRAMPFTRLASILAVPAVLSTALGDAGTRISSPSIDLPVLVFFAIGFLYVLECLEEGFRSTAAIAGTAMLSTATATRLLYAAPTVVAVGLLVLGTRTDSRPGRSAIRRVALVGIVPLVIAGGMAARQAILCGFPFYPSTAFALHVDWMLPRSTVDNVNRFIAAFARSAFHDPNQVLSSWHWFKPWLGNHVRTLNTLGPAAFLVAVLPAAVLLRRTAITRCRERRRPLLGALALCLVSLAIWFHIAPEPRFAYGPLWFTAIIGLAAILPSGLVAIKASLWQSVAVVAVAVPVIAVVVVNAVHGHAYRVIHASGTGPLGSIDPQQPTLVAYTTQSGLKLRYPLHARRECWRALYCTPTANKLVRQRGSRPADGFARIRR